jgi:hypothetical protein
MTTPSFPLYPFQDSSSSHVPASFPQHVDSSFPLRQPQEGSTDSALEPIEEERGEEVECDRVGDEDDEETIVMSEEWARRFAETAERRKRRKIDRERKEIQDIREETRRIEMEKKAKREELFGSHQGEVLGPLEGRLNGVFDAWSDIKHPSVWPDIPLKFL